MSGLAAKTDELGQKALGAFYTGEAVANRLVEWAIRRREDTVLDPSCGDGAFLVAATSRLTKLGCLVARLYGVDVSADALRVAGERAHCAELVRCDFFDLGPQSLPIFDCIVGNPPYIRYQTFNGNSISKAHQRAKEAGVKLPQLSSSWAPFLLHSSRFLRRGGRLAMVVPTELGHAKYAQDVLRYLVRNFRSITIEMFRENLFSRIGQSTLLLLCDGFGHACQKFIVVSSDRLHCHEKVARSVDIDSIQSRTFRLNHYLLPEAFHSLYKSFSENTRLQRLGQVADVGIGYVTGANDFFHLSERESSEWKIGSKFLKPALLNLRGIESATFQHHHWSARKEAGEKVHLLSLPTVAKESLPSAIQRYLNLGETDGVADRYKCRMRKHWYVVPHVRVADAFLSYMSSDMPRLVTNPAGLVAPNTLHLLRFESGCRPQAYASAWPNSLTKLSCEMEGHALGGGLFKLEPSEAERVFVVAVRTPQTRMVLENLNQSPAGSPERTLDLLDRHLLRKEMGLTETECISLREAALRIELWRKHL
jgi:adenine-specific DNA methylase